MAETMMTHALRYIAQGFKVLPLKGKLPLTNHGLKDATILQIGVKEYWTHWPDANIGISTDGLAVLDFDAEHGGLESKEKIITKYGPLPPTRVHKTGGGGEHWIYRQPNGTPVRNTVKVLGFNGVDLRGSGGYIVAPPSDHASGKCYEIISEGPIAPCPDWLLMVNKPIGAILGNPVQPGQLIPRGEQNPWLFKRASYYRGRGDTDEQIFEKLKIDLRRCDQDPANPFTDKDLQRIAKSASRYPPDGSSSPLNNPRDPGRGGEGGYREQTF